MKDRSSARWNTINLCSLGCLDPKDVVPPLDEEELQFVENGKRQIEEIKKQRNGKPFTFGISADVDFDNPLYDSIYPDDFNEKLEIRRKK